MRKSVGIFLCLCLSFTLLAPLQAEEQIFISSGRHVKQKYPFAGGTSCCNCRVVHSGKLPNTFAAGEFSLITFYLVGSRSNSHYQRLKTGPTKLKLVLGDRSAVAMSEKVNAGTELPVNVPWIIQFKFDPPVQAAPGTAWRLEDGDNNLYSAVLLHSSDADQKGLPGIDEQSGCQYTHKVNSWYSVKFDSHAAPPPPVTSGIEIEKTGDMGFIVKLNGKKIYEAYAFYLKIDKSYPNLDGYNVEVLSEASGGNICEAFKNQIIRWRPDGTHSISKRFGNCKGPKVQQIDQNLYFSYESYVGRHSQKTHPAQIWEYAKGVLKQIPGPIPKPEPKPEPKPDPKPEPKPEPKPKPDPKPVPAPFKLKLLTPKYGGNLPQGNNPNCESGFVWTFSWEPMNAAPGIIKSYQIRILQPDQEKTLFTADTQETSHTFTSCEPIDNDTLQGWTWQVRALWGLNVWSEWSDVRKFFVDLLDITPPTAPQLGAPDQDTALNQLNDPDCAGGFSWRFNWETVQDEESGIAQYKIIIRRDGLATPVVEDTTTSNVYVYKSCTPLEDNQLTGWSWQVQAQDKAGNWGELSAKKDFSVKSIYPASPDIVSPADKATLLRGYHPTCGPGVVWKFDWKDVSHYNGIKQYRITIKRRGPSGQVTVADETVTQSEFTYSECKAPDDRYLTGWKWSVQAQNNAGYWSKKKTGGSFSVGEAPDKPNIIAPVSGDTLPQQNHPSVEDGFSWDFEWEPSNHPQGIMGYQIQITHKDMTAPLLDTQLDESKLNYSFNSTTAILDKPDGWTFKIRAMAYDKNQGDWSSVDFSVADYVATVLPSAPNLLLPTEGKTLPQHNNPTSRAGFVWTFEWEASTSDTPIKGYQIKIHNPSYPDLGIDHFVTEPKYAYHNSQGLKDANQLSGWTWKVKAQDSDDEWGEWTTEKTFAVAAYVPYKPEPPQPVSPSGGKSLGYTFNYDMVCENRLSQIRWAFFWLQPNENEVKDYEIYIGRQVEDTPVLQKITQSGMRTYEYVSCDIIEHMRTSGWYWKVRAKSRDDVWSEWSKVAHFRVMPFFPTVPKPKPAGTNNIMPQSNNPNNPNSFVWTFEWEGSHHPEYGINGVKEYYLLVMREGESTAYIWEENINALKFTHTSTGPLTDDRLDGWYWQIGASTTYGPSGLSEKQKFTVEPHQPPAPKLLTPESGGVMPQGNNDECDPSGYYWKFEWEPSSHPTGIKNYQLEVIRPNGSLEMSPTLTITYYYFMACRQFANDELQGWKWRVRAQSNRGQWSPWSEGQFEVGSYDPAPFQLLSPNDKAVLPQNNNPDCADGYSWTFDWEDSDHTSGIAKYHISIKKPDGTLIRSDPTQSNYTYSSCTPISDDDAKNWTWSVVAEANNGTYTGCIARTFDVQDIDKPSTPTLLYPEENHEFPDGSHYGDTLPKDAWNIVDFQFESSDSSGIKQYRLYIYQELDDGTEDVFVDTKVASTAAEQSYRGVITVTIPEDELTGWKAKVQSQDNAGNWSDWSSVRNFSFAPEPPPEEPTPPKPIQWYDTFTGGDPSGDVFRLELDTPGKLTKNYSYLSTDGLNYTVECETDASTGTITLRRYSFDEDEWIVMDTAAAEPNKTLILSGPFKTMYKIRVTICAKENSDNVVWDDSLPSIIGARIKFYDAQGRFLKEKFVDVAAYDIQACNEFVVEYLDGKPEYFTVLIWEDDVGDAHTYNTQRIGDDDDLIWNHDWKHQFWLVENVSLKYAGVEKNPISGGGHKCSSTQMGDCYLPIELPDDCVDILAGIANDKKKGAAQHGYIFRPRGSNEKDVHEEEDINITPDEWWWGLDIDFGIYPTKTKWWDHYYEPAYVVLTFGTPERM